MGVLSFFIGLNYKLYLSLTRLHVNKNAVDFLGKGTHTHTHTHTHTRNGLKVFKHFREVLGSSEVKNCLPVQRSH